MKKILLAGLGIAALAAGPAVAADLPMKAPVRTAAAIAPVGDWTGFYVGGHVGNGWGTKDWSNPEADPSERGADHVNGTMAGGQIGLNWQTGYLVFGIEVQASWAISMAVTIMFPPMYSSSRKSIHSEPSRVESAMRGTGHCST